MNDSCEIFHVKKISVPCPQCGHLVEVLMDTRDLNAEGTRPKSKSFRKYCTSCLSGDVSEDGHADIFAEFPCSHMGSAPFGAPAKGFRQQIDATTGYRFRSTVSLHGQ